MRDSRFRPDDADELLNSDAFREFNTRLFTDDGVRFQPGNSRAFVAADDRTAARETPGVAAGGFGWFDDDNDNDSDEASYYPNTDYEGNDDYDDVSYMYDNNDDNKLTSAQAALSEPTDEELSEIMDDVSPQADADMSSALTNEELEDIFGDQSGTASVTFVVNVSCCVRNVSPESK